MKKLNGNGEIVFNTGMKPGTDPDVVFARIVTPPCKKQEKVHTTYILMPVKLLAPKNKNDTLQPKLIRLVDMLLQVDNTIYILYFDDDTKLQPILTGTHVTKSVINIKQHLKGGSSQPKGGKSWMDVRIEHNAECDEFKQEEEKLIQ